MTTIAACTRTGTIASDSRVTAGHTVFTTGPKIFPLHDGVAGFAGTYTAVQKLIAWLQNPKSKKPTFGEDEGAEVLILKPDGLWVIDHWFAMIKVEEPNYAIGSGAACARAAMRMGATPEQAVAIACDLDAGSSLPVHTLQLPPPKKRRRKRA